MESTTCMWMCLKAAPFLLCQHLTASAQQTHSAHKFACDACTRVVNEEVYIAMRSRMCVHLSVYDYFTCQHVVTECYNQTEFYVPESKSSICGHGYARFRNKRWSKAYYISKENYNHNLDNLLSLNGSDRLCKTFRAQRSSSTVFCIISCYRQQEKTATNRLLQCTKRTFDTNCTLGSTSLHSCNLFKELKLG